MPTTVYVVDTQALIWYFTDSSKLSQSAKNAFNDIEHDNAFVVVPTIVLSEIMHLADGKRITLNISDLIAQLQQSTNFGIVSLDLMVTLLMIPLKDFEIHDRVIVATAKSFEAALITKDEHVRSSGVVNCIW